MMTDDDDVDDDSYASVLMTDDDDYDYFDGGQSTNYIMTVPVFGSYMDVPLDLGSWPRCLLQWFPTGC